MVPFNFPVPKITELTKDFLGTGPSASALSASVSLLTSSAALSVLEVSSLLSLPLLLPAATLSMEETWTLPFFACTRRLGCP